MTTSIITDIGGGRRNVQLGGIGVIAATYFFEESFDLVNWSAVTSTIAAPGTGAWSLCLNRPAAVPRMFFRARMQ